MVRSRLVPFVAAGLLAVPLVTEGSPAGADEAGCSATPPPGAVTFGELGRYSTNPPAGSVQTAAEIVAYEDGTLYVLNIGTVDVVDVSDPAAPVRTAQLALPSEPTSVAVNGGLVAVAVPAPVKTDPGQVLLFRGGAQVGAVTVGSLPDMVTFTPDGKLLAVANEGEPNSYGLADSVDPEGSVSVITTAPFRAAGAGLPPGSPQPVDTIRFTDFDAGGDRARELPAGVRIFGPGASVAQDLEPEYITIAGDNRTAWVSLQENNALARLDLRGKTVDRIIDLGYADHSQPGHGLDASDQDGTINIANWPVRGLYMPDGVANYSVDGTRFVLTANEGDARDWPGISSNGEEARRARSVADLTLFPDAADNLRLGRLNVTPFAPATTSGDKLTTLYSFGSRSFSIRTEGGRLLWDSGDDFECLTAQVHPANFNASNTNNTFDNRSDDKGPEPENVVVGRVGHRQLAMVALERIGGVMVYDVTDPRAPVFQQYLTTREFTGSVISPDSGPEGMAFVPADQSPTGRPLLAVGNEVTGTVNLWGVVAP
jgi:hypothetical protein